MMSFSHALVKFNGGRGALLCNDCRVVLKNGFDHEDRQHVCDACTKIRLSRQARAKIEKIKPV